MVQQANTALALGVAVLTVSDTRTAESDTSGDFLAGAAQEAGQITRQIRPICLCGSRYL